MPHEHHSRRLEAEIEAVFTRTETNPMRLPLRYEEYDDRAYEEVMAG